MEVDILDLIAFDGQKMLFHISNKQNHNGTTFYDGTSVNIQVLQKVYEGRIEAQEKEITMLHSLLEKALMR